MRKKNIDRDYSSSDSESHFSSGPSTTLRRRIWIRILLGILIAGAAVFYFTYNPGENGFFPRCPFLAITGYECPGCGSQRAIHHLLHGRVAEAWSMNPLLVILIPYLLLGAAAGFFYYKYTRTVNPRYAWAAWTRKNLYGATAAWVILAIVVLFTIFRNIFEF